MGIRLRNKFYQTLHLLKEPFNENQAKAISFKAMPSSGEPFFLRPEY
jgi:hypothetical protein